MSNSPQGAPDSQGATSYTAEELLILARMGATGAVNGAVNASISAGEAIEAAVEAFRTAVALQGNVLLYSDTGRDGDSDGMRYLENLFIGAVKDAALKAYLASTDIPQGAHDGLRAGQAIVEGRRERRAAAEPQLSLNPLTAQPTTCYIH